MKWKELRKIAVSGIGDFREHDLATQYLDKYIRTSFPSLNDVIILTDGSVGLAAAVELYCIRRGIRLLITHARWLELEKVEAWRERNQSIIDLSHELYAFWNGKNPGTQHCIELAEAKGIPITQFSDKSIRKEFGVKVNKIVLPMNATRRDNKDIRALVKEAEISNFFDKPKKKRSLYDRLRNADIIDRRDE